MDGQILVLAGPATLELELGNTAVAIARFPEILVVKYGNGATLSRRWVDESELREGPSSHLAFVDFIRLVFRRDVSEAANTDSAAADAVWTALTSGCIEASEIKEPGTYTLVCEQVNSVG